MTNLILDNGKQVIDTFQHNVFPNYDAALAFAKELGWDAHAILDRTDKISLKVEDDSIIDITLNCLVVDPGSVDYIYYL